MPSLPPIYYKRIDGLFIIPQQKFLNRSNVDTFIITPKSQMREEITKSIHKFKKDTIAINNVEPYLLYIKDHDNLNRGLIPIPKRCTLILDKNFLSKWICTLHLQSSWIDLYDKPYIMKENYKNVLMIA